MGGHAHRLHRACFFFIKFPELCNRIPARSELLVRRYLLVGWMFACNMSGFGHGPLPPHGDDAESGRYVICKSSSAICVTARGLAHPWGAMELQMETVCVCAC